MHEGGWSRTVGRYSFLKAKDLVGLRPLAALDDVELHFIALFQAFIAIALDRTVVDEDVGSSLAAEESIAFRIVEPLYRAFILCHFSQLPLSENGWRVVATYLCLTQELGAEFSGVTFPAVASVAKVLTRQNERTTNGVLLQRNADYGNHAIHRIVL